MNEDKTRFVWMALLAIGLAGAAFWAMDAADTPTALPEPLPETAAGDGSAEPDAAVEADPGLAAIDEAIAAAEARAAERDDDWLHLEVASNRYVDRARASGDWADYDKARDALERAFARAPDGSGPHLALAAFEYSMHRLEQAGAALDAIDGYQMVQPRIRSAADQLRADVAFHSGEYEDAKTRYEALLEGGRTAELLIAYAQYHWKTGDHATATTLLEEAGEASAGQSAGTRAWVSLVRGLFALERGAWDEALTHYRAGLSAAPESWLLEEHIAEILTLRGETALAMPIYERVVARTANPELMDALAAILREQGEEERAAELVRRARDAWETRLALFPEAAYGHAIDHWLEHEADPARTVELALANAEARPNGESKTVLAQAYLAAQRIEDARMTIDEVLESAWDTADAHAVASEIFAALGDEARSASERERAIALNPHALD